MGTRTSLVLLKLRGRGRLFLLPHCVRARAGPLQKNGKEESRPLSGDAIEGFQYIFPTKKPYNLCGSS